MPSGSGWSTRWTDRGYGAPRVTAELNDPASPDNAPAVGDAPSADVPAGDRDRSPGRGRLLEPVNHKRVARVMRERRIVGLRLRRKVRTTVPDPDLTPVADLLKRAFTATAPNLPYVGDITYLPFDGGNLYLATVIDCYSRRLVGWSIAEHMRTDLVSDALRAAAQQRGSLRGAVFHSDHGAQGGFNWSSQHLDLGGADGQASRVDDGVDGVVPDEVARSTLLAA